MSLDKGRGGPTEEEQRASRLMFAWAVVVLIPVAVIGAALSYESLYQAAEPVFHTLAFGFPLLVDFLILGASLVYVSGAKVGRPRAGWRLTAHAGVAATLALNAYASVDRPMDIPWHVTAPAVWSVLVELTAREMLGRWRSVHETPSDRIPLHLWLTAPGESVRTAWLMARTGQRSAAAARIDADSRAAARDALARTLPGWRHRRTRRQITRRLWAGSIEPATVFAAIGWLTDDPAHEAGSQADHVIRVALRAVTVAQPVSRPALARPARGAGSQVARRAVAMPAPGRAVSQVIPGPVSRVSQSTESSAAVAHGVEPQVEPQVAVDRPVAMNTPQDAVLAVMEPGVDYGMGEIVIATGRPRATVKRAVSGLIGLGLVTASGDPAKPRYALAQPGALDTEVAQ